MYVMYLIKNKCRRFNMYVVILIYTYLNPVQTRIAISTSGNWDMQFCTS